FFDGTATDRPIEVDDVQVATYSIVDGQVIVTFNEAVNNFDDVEMSVNLSGTFDIEVFETEEEVVVNVPFQDTTSYTATIRLKQQEYDGTDKKEAGNPYIIENGKKVSVDKNPTHIDWTVTANDNMDSFEKATVIDDLGNNLKIVEDSFIVYRLVRNYNNEIIDRVPVNITPEITNSGFKLDLGAIKDAYEITYSTEIIRPDGGGTHTINNNARIVLDGDEEKVNDNFEGTWSGDLPIINKEGKSTDNPHVIDWQVEYNYGKE